MKEVHSKLEEAKALLDSISDNLKYALRTGNDKIIKETVRETLKMLQ